MATLDKNKFIGLKKFIKEEPGTTQRLQSIKIPRDLNLGLPKQQKKVFVPNVNAVRNRNRPKEYNRKEDKGKERYKELRQNKKDNTPKYVQSSGVFSEGVGNDVVRPRGWVGLRFEKDNNDSTSTPSITMPTIKKNSFQVDKTNEDSILNKITGVDEESDDEKLPFKPIPWQNNLQKPTLITQIKKEDEDDVTPNLKKLKLEFDDIYNPPIVVSNEYLEDNCNDNPSISLWGLPDSFAGKGLSDDPNCKKLFDYCLTDMNEGQIGKVVVRKSGRMEIHIGHMKYELEPGESDSYKEDIISLETQETSKRINAANLGNIKYRYFLSPDWDRLLL